MSSSNNILNEKSRLVTQDPSAALPAGDFWYWRRPYPGLPLNCHRKYPPIGSVGCLWLVFQAGSSAHVVSTLSLPLSQACSNLLPPWAPASEWGECSGSQETRRHQQLRIPKGSIIPTFCSSVDRGVLTAFSVLLPNSSVWFLGWQPHRCFLLYGAVAQHWQRTLG